MQINAGERITLMLTDEEVKEAVLDYAEKKCGAKFSGPWDCVIDTSQSDVFRFILEACDE